MREIIDFFQGSLSLPGSPFNIRRGSRSSGNWRTNQLTGNGSRSRGCYGMDRKPLVLQTYVDAQEHLPFADDSAAVTPMSEDNGAIIIPLYSNLQHSRRSSYTSHSSRLSYTSHGEVYCLTKESQLRSRSRNLTNYFYDQVKPSQRTLSHLWYCGLGFLDFNSGEKSFPEVFNLISLAAHMIQETN